MSVVARRYLVRGQDLLARGDWQSALEPLRAAVDLAPACTDARIGYAVALAQLNDCPSAAQVLRVGLGRALTPVATGALYATLGDVLVRGGDFLSAEDAYRHAARIPGYMARAASGLAKVYGRLGRFADMAAQLRVAASAPST